MGDFITRYALTNRPPAVGVWFVIWQNIGNTKIGQYLTGDLTQMEGATNQVGSALTAASDWLAATS